jgi:hypothetical protein
MYDSSGKALALQAKALSLNPITSKKERPEELYMTVIPAFRRLRKEDCKFKACFATKQDPVSINKKRQQK